MPSHSGDIAFIDFETRSEVDLTEVGSYVYAEHPSTRILCLCWAIGDMEPQVWIEGQAAPDALGLHIAAGGLVSGWNSGSFERLLWARFFRYASIPLSQWRDTMAQAACAGFPLSLDKCAQALVLTEQKDSAGRRIMLKWCKPLPLKKTELLGRVRWADDPTEYAALIDYCKQDVRTERAIARALPPMSASQQATWALTQRINDRGLPVDLAGINIIQRSLENARAWWGERVEASTNGIITADDLMAPAKLRVYTQARGVSLDDLTKETVTEALTRPDVPADVKVVLEARAAVGRSSTKKLDAMLACSGIADGRVRGTLCYHGAHTGRWAGRLVQPQNFPNQPIAEVDECLTDMRGPADLFRMLWGDPYDAAAGLLRGMIQAEHGNLLVAADYSAIEARVLAWLAEERWRLDVFRTHGRIYEASAAQMFHIPLESITKSHPARKKGKVSELALGYQGSVGAMLAMGAISMGLTEAELPEIVAAWRAASPNIVSYWRIIDLASKRACREPGLVVPCGPKDRIMFRRSKENGLDTLRCRLPSGRVLFYPYPQLGLKPSDWGEREVLSYMGVHPKTHQWTRLDTYGGKLVENIVQAVSADLITEGMLHAESAGFPLVMSIHDEAVAEVPADRANVKAFEDALATCPKWADCLPLKAEGFAAQRYGK